MIGATGERSAKTPGARTSDERAHETAELRPPERQRGLLSFLTWPVLLAQASVAEAALGDKAASLHSEEQQSDAAAASLDARNPAPADHHLPGAPAGSLGRDELSDALEGPALPGFQEDFARVDGPEADGGEHAASLARRSADDPEAQGGGGGGGGGSSRPADPRSASAEAQASGDEAHAAAVAARALGPAVSFDDAVQPGDIAWATLQAGPPAPASVGETLIGGTLTGVVDTGLGTVATVGHGVSPVVTDVAGVAADLVDVALQPVGPVLDVVAPVDSVAPIVTGVAGVATDVVGVALQPVGPVLDVVAPVVNSVAPIVTGVAAIATDVVDDALQPVGSTLETVQPVVAGLAATVTEIAEPLVDVIPPVVESVPAIVTDVAGVATGVVDDALQPVGSALETVPVMVESVPSTIMDLAAAATDLGDAASQPVEPVLSDVPSVVSDLSETATGIAGISAEDITTVVDTAPATDTGEPLVTTALDSVRRIGGDSPSDADADPSAAGDEPDAPDAGSVGTLGGALASGGVIVIDGGAPPTERTSTDDGGYTDFDLALRDLTLAGQGTKSADGRANDDTSATADASTGSRDEANDKADDEASEAAGPLSPDEHDSGDTVGTDTLLGGVTHAVDEIALRGDHHLL